MQKPWKIELALVLSIVFCMNSFVMIGEYFLIPYLLTIPLSLAALACCFLLINQTLGMNPEFGSQFWDIFNLMAADFAARGDGVTWNSFYRGWVTFLLGFAILIFYKIYTWARSTRKGQEPRPDSDGPVRAVPVLANVSYLLMGNGVAIMGRSFLPTEGCERMVAGGCGMFFASTISFCCYHKHSVKNQDPLLI